jgi:hypothetical protein
MIAKIPVAAAVPIARNFAPSVASVNIPRLDMMKIAVRTSAGAT